MPERFKKYYHLILNYIENGEEWGEDGASQVSVS